MASLQVGCDLLGVRVHSGDTGEDVCCEGGDLSWPPGVTYLPFLSCPPPVCDERSAD